MRLMPPEVLSIALACAPQVAPSTLLAVATAESALDPLAIGAPPGVAPPPARSRDEAVRNARSLIAAGHAVDLGLAQVNVRNLPRLGLTVEEAFDPCRNLAAAARVLLDGYRRVRPGAGSDQRALRSALSIYNTGHASRGLANGYVTRVLAAAGVPPRARPGPGPTMAEPAPPPLRPFVLTVARGDRP